MTSGSVDLPEWKEFLFMDPMRGCIVYMLHAEELLDIGVNGFLANILMVKDDGHHELQDFQILQSMRMYLRL